MKKLILFVILSLSFFTASAKLYSVSATLSGANEVPANASTATGTLTGTFDDVSLVLNITVTFNGLISNANAAHIHKAAVGVNGPVQIPLVVPAAQSGTFSYSGTLTSTQAADLLAGLYYVNIHNASFPGGEIRGQLAVGMEVFSNSTINVFNGIGGYSYTQETFPNGVQSNPYVVTGPSPQNSFTYTASAIGGITNVSSSISTSNIYTPITIQFKGNNVRKFGCRAFASIFGGGGTTSDIIQLTATTNLGNIAVINGGTSNLFVGFRVLNENEYIVSIQATFLNITASVIALRNIVVGDDQAQNVALNFDGVNDHVALPSTVGNFASNATFTVSCWVKPASLQSDLVNTDVEILEKWDGASNAYPFVIRYLNENIANGANVGKIVAARYNGIAAPSIMSSVSIKDGKWHHIAFVVDAVGIKLFIDGVLSASGNDFTPQQANTPCTNTSPLYVGSRNSINHFKGEIDEVRLWTVGKTQTEIQNEMFCKNPITTNLQAAYNFNNGVPNGNNNLISQIQDAVGTNHGTLSGFTKTGDASNFVTGQVKYVFGSAGGSNNGTSWANAFTDIQSALTPNTCNDLVEVYVAVGNYKPSVSDVNISYNVPSGMQIFGGFATTEKNINERNLALIHSTNKTTLLGDLGQNDTQFNFASNRTDNSKTVVTINGSNVTFDGFTVTSGQTNGIRKENFADIKISNCKMVDNGTGLYLNQANSTVSNCVMAGNNTHGIYIYINNTIFQNCLIVNNGSQGIYQDAADVNQINLINSTIAANGGYGIYNYTFFTPSSIINTIKNTIIKDNATGGIVNSGPGPTTNNITFSLVQGVTTGTGNLNGNTVNPQFVSPFANNVKSDAGDYRLKWCSLAIGAGTNTGITPLDLDRNPRNFNATADMGAYEFLGNTPSQVAASTISGTIDSPTYSGGAIQTITSTAKILAPAGAIDFKVPNSITLNPGFEARGMSKYFKAQIGVNVACSN